MSARSLPRAQKSVLRNVQALRAAAASIVVLMHMQLPHNGVDLFSRPLLHVFSDFGGIGVDVFFAISGFIMLVSNWDHFAKPHAGAKFFLHRAIRIYPAYWLSLIPAIIAFFLLRKQVMTGHVAGKTDFLASFLLYPQPVEHTLLPVSWTLVFEMTFYAIFAFALLAERRYLVPLLGVWLIAQIALWVTLGRSHDPYLLYASTALPIEFIFGVLIGILFMRRTLPAAKLAFGLGLAAAAAVWALTVWFGPIFDDSMARVVVFGIPSALILYGAVALEAKRTILAPLWLVAVGDASYAMYLWHFPVIGTLRFLVLRLHPSGRVAEVVTLVGVYLCVLALSFLVYHGFERPATTWLNARAARLWKPRKSVDVPLLVQSSTTP